jgi:hypothetical protein
MNTGCADFHADSVSCPLATKSVPTYDAKMLGRLDIFGDTINSA